VTRGALCEDLGHEIRGPPAGQRHHLPALDLPARRHRAPGPLHASGRGADRLQRARLTDREGEVLELMAKGRSNAEIAGELVVSVETVKTHVGNVLAKLQARDRTQAVIAAYESGFVSPS
jgi:DNA-binding NarL/FixJ family response regulator